VIVIVTNEAMPQAHFFSSDTNGPKVAHLEHLCLCVFFHPFRWANLAKRGTKIDVISGEGMKSPMKTVASGKLPDLQHCKFRAFSRTQPNLHLNHLQPASGGNIQSGRHKLASRDKLAKQDQS